jgi:hypothetical protein
MPDKATDTMELPGSMATKKAPLPHFAEALGAFGGAALRPIPAKAFLTGLALFVKYLRMMRLALSS